jgi:hypothetical protein
MKMFFILGSALVASAAAAQQPASGGTNASGYDPNEVICRMITETGSRLARQRRCMTRAGWDQSQRQDRSMISDAQLRQVNPQSMTPAERAAAIGRYYSLPGRTAF